MDWKRANDRVNDRRAQSRSASANIEARRALGDFNTGHFAAPCYPAHDTAKECVRHETHWARRAHARCRRRAERVEVNAEADQITRGEEAIDQLKQRDLLRGLERVDVNNLRARGDRAMNERRSVVRGLHAEHEIAKRSRVRLTPGMHLHERRS